VRGIDLEGEEFKISISKSFALHDFDLVVGGLQRSCGNGMIVVGEECGPHEQQQVCLKSLLDVAERKIGR
jgi:hypothetical protein